MDKITNNIVNNLPKKDIQDPKSSINHKVNTDILDKSIIKIF